MLKKKKELMIKFIKVRFLKNLRKYLRKRCVSSKSGLLNGIMVASLKLGLVLRTLSNETYCSYRFWQLIRILFRHAYACLFFMGKELEDAISFYYLTNNIGVVMLSF